MKHKIVAIVAAISISIVGMVFVGTPRTYRSLDSVGEVEFNRPLYSPLAAFDWEEVGDGDSTEPTTSTPIPTIRPSFNTPTPSPSPSPIPSGGTGTSPGPATGGTTVSIGPATTNQSGATTSEDGSGNTQPDTSGDCESSNVLGRRLFGGTSVSGPCDDPCLKLRLDEDSVFDISRSYGIRSRSLFENWLDEGKGSCAGSFSSLFPAIPEVRTPSSNFTDYAQIGVTPFCQRSDMFSGDSNLTGDPFLDDPLIRESIRLSDWDRKVLFAKTSWIEEISNRLRIWEAIEGEDGPDRQGLWAIQWEHYFPNFPKLRGTKLYFLKDINMDTECLSIFDPTKITGLGITFPVGSAGDISLGFYWR